MDSRGSNMPAMQEANTEAKQRDADLRWLMAHPAGRRFLWSTFQQCGVDRVSFTGNSDTFFREGQRSVALQLAADAKALAPDHYKQMLIENL